MSLVFTSSALKGVNKAGVLLPDEDGYYDVILGALEEPNSYGAIYKLQSAREIFSPNSPFMRLVEKGMLFGEYGHPIRQPGMSDMDWMSRIHQVQEDKKSHHIKEIRIDEQAVDVKGRKYIAIRGKVKPCGPYGKHIEEDMKTKGMPVSFSIRSLTNDTIVSGVREKHLVTVVTWDYVNEPGLAQATKWNAPALENFHQEILKPETIREAILRDRKSGLSMESASRMEMSLEAYRKTIKPLQGANKPWMSW